MGVKRGAREAGFAQVQCTRLNSALTTTVVGQVRSPPAF
jgi:hypothetical protein